MGVKTMRERSSNKTCIFTIIGVIVVAVSAAALIIIYRDRIYNFLSRTKDFLCELRENIFTSPAFKVENCDYYDEYEDFADI